MKPFKKRSRLRNFDYMGHYRYFITICTHERRPLFHDGILVGQITGALKTKSDAFGVAVWAFCFMPDHVHFLLEGTSHSSDLKKFISSYKQYTAFHYKKSVTQDFSPASWGKDRAKALNYGTRPEGSGRGEAGTYVRRIPQNARSVEQGFSPAKSREAKLWQPSYYDHVLRNEDDTLATARYIFENPVRKNLATHYSEYQFMGSFELDIVDFF